MYDKRLTGTWRSDKRRTHGSTDVRPLRVVAKDADSVVVIGTDALTGEDLIYHLHFEGPPTPPGQPSYYWVSLGGFREYFRRVRQVRASAVTRGK